MTAEAAPAGAIRVAVDLPGAPGERTYDYLPPLEGAVGIGDGVVVPFGGRRAVGIVVAIGGEAPPGIAMKAIEARIGERPLLGARSMQLAEVIAARWAAPLALTIRSLLPPGLLDRVERVVRLAPSAVDGAAGDTGIGREWQPLDRLPGARGAGRPALLRELRRLEGLGSIERSWRLAAAGARVVEERVAARTAETARPARLGARQAAALDLLDAAAPLADPFLPVTTLPGGAGTARRLAELGLVRIEVRRIERRHASRRQRPATAADRELAWSAGQLALLEALRTSRPAVLLVDGAPGSGKSRAAAAAAAEVLDSGRSVLWLVPETSHVSLAADLLAEATPVEPELVHSGMSRGERLDAHHRLQGEGPHLVVGTRAALAACEGSIGLVVVDEEHEGGYKSDRAPRLQARDAAILLAASAGAPALLLSATPSIESLARAQREGWHRITLAPRARGATIEVVDLRRELADGWRGMISRPLLERLGQVDWEGGAQALLIINRRGLASALLCRDCGSAQSCPACERPLVLHSAGTLLRCHGCGLAAEPLTRCPSCQSARVRALGGGTERLEAEARRLFPDLAIDRLDADAAAPIGAGDRILDRFRSGETQLLVGTALAAKSLDLPSLSLVGIVSADTGLLLPDERAAERTVAFVVQAAGRLGRGREAGVAVVQSYRPEDPAIAAAVAIAGGGGVEAWRALEIERRRAAGGAPFLRTVKFTVAAPSAAGAKRRAEGLRERLAEVTGGASDIRLYGPIPAWVPRRAGTWREIVVLRAPDPLPAAAAVAGRDVVIDPDPETLL